MIGWEAGYLEGDASGVFWRQKQLPFLPTHIVLEKINGFMISG